MFQNVHQSSEYSRFVRSHVIRLFMCSLFCYEKITYYYGVPKTFRVRILNIILIINTENYVRFFISEAHVMIVEDHFALLQVVITKLIVGKNVYN